MSYDPIFGGPRPQNWLQLFAEQTGGNSSPDTGGTNTQTKPLPGTSHDAPDFEDDADDKDWEASLREAGLLVEDDDKGGGDDGDGKSAQEQPDKKDDAKGTEQPADKQDEPPAKEEPKEKTLTQAEVDRIIGERLARERAAMERKVKEATGKDLKDLLAEQRQVRIAQAQEQFAMSPEEAQAYVQLQEENARLKAEREEVERARQEAQYLREKAELASKPFYSQFEKDIEDMHQQFKAAGQAVPLSQVYTYVIGQKAASGELQQALEQAAEQKAIRLAQRSKTAPESAAGQGTAQGLALSEAEIMIAKKLGIKPQDYAAEAAKLKRSKR